MRKSLFVLGLAVLSVVIGGCVQPGSATDKKAEEKPVSETPASTDVVIPIEAEHPKRGDISSHYETTTRVQAENRVQVLAEGAGECRKLHVDEGDLVKAGDLLAELDTAEMLAKIGQTEVQIRQTRTQYEIAEKSLSQGIGSKAERDNAKFAYEQAQALVEMEKVQLSKLTISAPIGGLVTQRNIQEGQVISPGMPVFQIVDPASFMLVISPPEKELPRLREGQEAKVTIDSLGNEEFSATVRRINPNVDPLSGTVKVTLDFDKDTQGLLREAAFARVRLVMDTHSNALLVSKDCVIEESARRYVFVVREKSVAAESAAAPGEAPAEATEAAATDSAEEGTQEPMQEPTPVTAGEAQEPVYFAERVEVQTGLEDSNYFEVLSGIDSETLVVTLGQHNLKSGARVRLSTAESEIKENATVTAEDALKKAEERKAEAEKAAGN